MRGGKKRTPYGWVMKGCGRRTWKCIEIALPILPGMGISTVSLFNYGGWGDTASTGYLEKGGLGGLMTLSVAQYVSWPPNPAWWTPKEPVMIQEHPPFYTLGDSALFGARQPNNNNKQIKRDQALGAVYCSCHYMYLNSLLVANPFCLLTVAF